MRFFSEQIFASTISNMLGIIIGHPLDTIKVRQALSLDLLLLKGSDANGSLLKVCYQIFERNCIEGRSKRKFFNHSSLRPLDFLKD
jgi:hypothetical protein